MVAQWLVWVPCFASEDLGHDIKLFIQVHLTPVSPAHYKPAARLALRSTPHCPALPLPACASVCVNRDFGLSTSKGKAKLKEFLT